MNAHKLIVMAAGLLALVAAEAGTLYKIVDKDGNVTYTSRPPANVKGKVERKNLHVTPGEPGAAEALARVAAEKPVVLYSVEECEQCDRAREYLRRRGTPFTEKDVNKDPAFRVELKNRTGSLYIPTILLGDKVMKGYIQSLLEGELDAVGYPRATPTEGAQPGEAGEATAGTEEGGATPEPQFPPEPEPPAQ